MSLTPNVRLIRARSSIGRASRPSCRSGEMGGLSCGVGRAGRAASRSAAAARRAREASSSAWRGERAARAGIAARSSWLRARSVSPRPSSLGAAGGRLRGPCVRLGRRGDGVGIEQQAAELHGGDPVDHAVVGLADHADPPVVEPVGDPDLPQRALRAAAASTCTPRPPRRAGPTSRRTTCREMSKSRSSTQTGALIPSGTDRSVCRYRGARGSRRAMCSRSCSKLGLDPVARAARRPPPSPRACGRSASPPPGTRRQAATGA